ncbi:MAG: SAF domain-containing protein, partial [Elusimicrobiota bacterium]|nr:SAF domain-containing protein [Elusimicrobiota bacterium]
MKKTLLLSILFAVITALCAFWYLDAIKTKYKSMDESAKVVIANQNVPQGALIKKEMLTEISVPKQYIQPKSFNSLDKLFS